jgi:nucleotide-binding universal stress UspA family protein
MYKTILFPVDLGEDSSWTTALPRALELCGLSDAELHVLTVAPGINTAVAAYLPANSAEKIREDADNALNAFIKEQVPGDIKVHAISRQGETVYQAIHEVAGEVGADLIVMASHRPALSDYLLGPNAARVVRHASCSVLVVRG